MMIIIQSILLGQELSNRFNELNEKKPSKSIFYLEKEILNVTAKILDDLYIFGNTKKNALNFQKNNIQLQPINNN